MNGLKLACLRVALAIALVVAAVPAPAIATDDPWPGIRADYREGDFAAALASLRTLLARNPADREALYYLAIIQWRLEDYPAAAAAYRRVLALDPEGPFGQDARMWLATYAHLARATPTPAPTPRPTPVAVATPRPAPSATVWPSIAPIVRAPSAAPSAAPSRAPARKSVLPLAALRPSAGKAPWLQAQPKGKSRRPRSANPRPGYFKVADGSFEFIPPAGFVLLDEGTHGTELTTLFGLPKAARKASVPATLLITWREITELAPLKPDQRMARERQLLAMEASMYGPGARLEARFGGPCYRVRQAQGAWGADTLLFFQHRKLYAITFGGSAEDLARYQARVEQSWQTPIFYP